MMIVKKNFQIFYLDLVIESLLFNLAANNVIAGI